MLEVRDLYVEFHTSKGIIEALDGVNLHVGRGESVGLVGESGCGKSVTGLAILGLVQQPQGRVKGGRVLFRGEDILAKNERELEHIRGSGISMVFQDPMASLNPVFSVGNQVADVVRRHLGCRRQEALYRTLEMLRLVGLPDADVMLRAYPHQLSGGMCQRVCIAMALASRPSLIIADEPTTALDVTIQAQILQLLTDLRDRLEVSVLLITHNIGVAAQTCDRVAVMYAGSVVEVGATRSVLKQPQHPYTVGLLGCLPEVGKRVEQLVTMPGAVPNLLNPPSGCRFHPRCPHAQPICSQKKPALAPAGPDRSVACFLHGPPGVPPGHHRPEVVVA